MRQAIRALSGLLKTVGVLLYATAACAENAQQGSLKSLSLEDLGKIEVTTVSREPEQVWHTAAAVYIITHDDIVRSGATTIPEALRLAPGVEVARIASNKWAIGIRGFGSRLSRSVLVLIDGRTVYTPLFAGTYWEVQDTLLEDIDRIEVIRGPGGTIWGPNAINGVINIITRSSKDTRGLYVDAGGGNVERGFADVRFGAGNPSGTTYRAYLKGFNRGPEFHPDGENFDVWRAGQAGFRTDWGSRQNSFTVQGDIYDQLAGERVTAVTYTPPYSQVVDADARLSGGNIMGHWTRTFAEGKDLQLQAYYDRTNRHEPNLGELRDTFDVDFLFRLPAGSRQSITWGAGMRFSHADNIEVVSGLTFDPAERTDQLFTGYIQDEITVVPRRFSITAGTKILHTNFTGVDLQPTLRFLYTPSDTQTLWAAFTRAVRTPSDVERDFFLSGFVGPGPGGVPLFARFNANRDFHSEILQGYELGYRRLISKEVFVDIAGFFNQYFDLLSEDIVGGPFLESTPTPPHFLIPAEFGNGLKGTTEGGEVAPEWRPTTFWRLRGSYSFLEMHIERGAGSLDVGSAPGIEGSSPQHQVSAQSAFDLPKALSLDLMYRYVSALPGQMVPAYHTADARLAWQVKSLTFSVVGNNLFQPWHYEFGNDPGLIGIKRAVYGEIQWRREARSTP